MRMIASFPDVKPGFSGRQITQNLISRDYLLLLLKLSFFENLAL